MSGGLWVAAALLVAALPLRAEAANMLVHGVRIGPGQEAGGARSMGGRGAALTIDDPERNFVVIVKDGVVVKGPA